MNNHPILILLLLPVMAGWSDAAIAQPNEILKQEHTRLEDYHAAWGKGFDQLAPPLSSQSGLQPAQILIDKSHSPSQLLMQQPHLTNGESRNWGILPHHEKHTEIVTAHGYAWCMVQTENQWILMQADINGTKAEWQPISSKISDDVNGFTINRNGDLSILLFDKNTLHYSSQTAMIHSGGKNVTWNEPEIIAGNQQSARQEWEKQCGKETVFFQEFDLGKTGEFLAVSHSISHPDVLVRYRISPETGMPYSQWSTPVAPGSLQLKKDGRFLQYQIILKENTNWDELPQISVTYTYPDSNYAHPEQPKMSGYTASGNAESINFDNNNNKNDDNQTEMEQENDEDSQSNQTDLEEVVVSPGDNSPEQKQDHDGSGVEQLPNHETPSEKQEEMKQTDENKQIQSEDDKSKQNLSTLEMDDEKQNEQESEKKDETAVETIVEKTDKTKDQQESKKESQQQPINNTPDSTETENQPNEQDDPTEEPEFTSPFNRLIGKPAQEPKPSQENSYPSQQVNSAPEPNSKSESSPQQQNNNTDNPDNHDDAMPDPPHNEEPNIPNHSNDGSTTQPSQNKNNENSSEHKNGNSSPQDQNGSGNPMGDEPGSPNSSSGIPGNEAAGNPQAGVPQAQGDASGVPFPGIEKEKNGLAYQPNSNALKRNPSKGSGVSPKQNGNHLPGKQTISSPTSVCSASTEISINKVSMNKETQPVPIDQAAKMAGGAGLLSVLFLVKGKKRKTQMNVDPRELEDSEENLDAGALDSFTSGEKLLYTLVPKREDSVWDHAIAFDPSVTAVDVAENRVITLHDDGSLYADQQDNLHAKTALLGKWNKQGNAPQMASSGLPFFAAGLNVKGQINICQGKQSGKSFIEEQKPLALSVQLHALKQMNFKQNKLWLMGESFEKNILLCASVTNGKVFDWKTVVPQDAPEGCVIGFSTSGKDLIAYTADNEPGIARIYQRDTARGGWELTAKCHYEGGQVCLSVDEKRCFMAEWLEGESTVSIHAFTRDGDGRFAGHYVNKVDLPFDADIVSGTFKNNTLTLQGKQTTPKGETRIVSCGASIRKLLSVPSMI